MVATSQPLAAAAGLDVLLRGGNAVDAAIATAAVLSVIEPTMNGVGSDAFALVWDGDRLHGLNGSGRSPQAWTRARFARRRKMPATGWDACTVPGAVHAWCTLWERFGSRPFAELLAPAIAYAREGFPVAPVTAQLWHDLTPQYRRFAEFRRVFLPGGRAPRAGERFRNPDLADTLAAIADTNGAALYGGFLAARLEAVAAAEGGAMTARDLADHRSDWVNPIAVKFAGTRVHELPPNGQGLASLIALGILERLQIGRFGVDSADSVHLQIEAMKAAFAVVRRHVADPEAMTIAPASLLSPRALDALARPIHLRRAALPERPMRAEHGTVYLATGDGEGRMVSFIQSNYLGFGSGVVVPGTGIALQNRALGFSLDPRHPNCVAGNKRPFHTIMPGFMTAARGEPRAAFGVMGGHMQPQGHVQLMVRVAAHAQNPQAAIDGPRWYVDESWRVGLEPGFAPDVERSLRRRGHRLLAAPPTVLFGGAQMIHRVGDFHCGASDPRKDGQAVGA